jgi:hypothetical protein
MEAGVEVCFILKLLSPNNVAEIAPIFALVMCSELDKLSFLPLLFQNNDNL